MVQISSVKNFTGIKHNISELRELTKNYSKSVDVVSKNFDIRSAKRHYSEFLKTQIENPTRAMIAKWEMYRNFPIKNSFSFEHNREKLINNPEIKDLKIKITKRIRSLYPQTADLREVLAAENRIVFDKVTPKLKGIKKFWLNLHLFV